MCVNIIDYLYYFLFYFILGQKVPVSCESLTSGFIGSLPSPSHRHRDVYLSPRQLTSHEILARDELEPEVPHYLRSPSCRSLTSAFYEPERLRAKRRLDVDEEYVSTPKRLKYGKFRFLIFLNTEKS